MTTRKDGVDDRMGRTLTDRAADRVPPALSAVPSPTAAKELVRFTSDLPEDLDDFLTVYARRARKTAGRSVRKVNVNRALLELLRMRPDLQDDVAAALHEGIGFLPQ